MQRLEVKPRTLAVMATYSWYPYCIRALSLYFFTVDDPADELNIGPTRKKKDESAFILFSPSTCHKTVLKSYIFRQKSMKFVKLSFYFFLSCDMNM